MGKNIVLIGAGSSSFTVALLRSLLRNPDFHQGTIALVDIDPEMLKLVEQVSRRIVAAAGSPIQIVATTDRRAALVGADYVTVTVAAGGDTAWEHDLQIPTRYGCVQPVGDTCGIGGLSRGLRHVPILVGVARDMVELCPRAWLFNFTNPMSLLTRAVCRETPIRCMGLCVGVEIIRKLMAWAINAAPQDCDIRAAGINHFMFAYRFFYRGTDAAPLAIARMRQAFGASDPATVAAAMATFPGLDLRPDQPIRDVQKFSTALAELTGFFPGPGDTHVSEFVPQFFRTADDLAAWGLKLYDLDGKRKWAGETRQLLRDMADGSRPVDPEKLGDFAHEESQAVDIIHSFLSDDGRIFHVNLPNHGQIPNLPLDAIVEGPTRMSAFGAEPLHVGPLPELIASWTRPWLAWQELVIDAALTGSRERALAAMLADPGCRGIETSRRMLDDVLAANQRWLPQFAPRP